jgi:hypothetical protein
MFGGRLLTGRIMADILPRLTKHLNTVSSVGAALVLQVAKALSEDCFAWFQVCACVCVCRSSSGLHHIVQWV